MLISFNCARLQIPQRQTHRHPTTAPLPSHHRLARHTPSNPSGNIIGNIIGNTIGKHSGNAIGKIGNAPRLLPFTMPTALATHIPGKISPRGTHPITTIAPAIPPATFRQKIGNHSGNPHGQPVRLPPGAHLATLQSAEADFAARSAFRRGFNRRPTPGNPSGKKSATFRHRLRQRYSKPPTSPHGPFPSREGGWGLGQSPRCAAASQYAMLPQRQRYD